MAQKIIQIPGVGPVVLAKRRGAKNLRLSILPTGKIRVSLPFWVPYSAGIKFVIDRADWIKHNSQDLGQIDLKHGQRIGKSHRLKFVSKTKPQTTQARLGINSITITTYLDHSHEDVQRQARLAAERALKKEARALLEPRLKLAAQRAGLSYKELKIKRLTSRWGSCSSQGVITLNYFLVQLPWHLIDYVIAHELAHTAQLNHSRAFWELVERMSPNSKQFRKEIKSYRPILTPSD